MLLHQEQRQALSQRIDPKIILANTILQLTTLELSQSIESELLENPALDIVDDAVCQGDCIDPKSCPYCSARVLKEHENLPQSETLDSGDHETEYESLFEANAFDGGEEYDPLSNLEAEVTLEEHLRNLMRAAVPAEDHWIGEYIINSLDEWGWLDGATEGIAAELGVPESDVCRLLQVVQSLDPPGVGARDLRECLLIQLRHLREEATASATKTIETAEHLVRDHWDHLSSHRYTKLARSAGISREEALLCVEFIRTRLNPYPAGQFRPPWAYRPSNQKAAVRPDVIIRRAYLGYEVEVLGAEPFGLCVNPAFRDIYTQVKNGTGRHSDEDKKYYTEWVERAELFIRNINQRRHTLRQITKCIVDLQTGFLETGSRQFLRPLTRTRVAQMLSMHESTVSRATANKYVQLPNQEVVGFDVFFDSSLSVKDVIIQILQDEDANNPLSDKQIAEILRERGMPQARRTIVKYRESLKILSSTRRRH